MKKVIYIFISLIILVNFSYSKDSRIDEGLQKIKEGLSIIFEEVKEKSGETAEKIKQKINELEKELDKEKIKENVDKIKKKIEELNLFLKS